MKLKLILSLIMLALVFNIANAVEEIPIYGGPAEQVSAVLVMDDKYDQKEIITLKLQNNGDVDVYFFDYCEKPFTVEMKTSKGFIEVNVENPWDPCTFVEPAKQIVRPGQTFYVYSNWNQKIYENLKSEDFEFAQPGEYRLLFTYFVGDELSFQAIKNFEIVDSVPLLPTKGVELVLEGHYVQGKQIPIKIINNGREDITFHSGCGIRYTIQKLNGNRFEDLTLMSPCGGTCSGIIINTLEPGDTGEYGVWSQTHYDDVCDFSTRDVAEKADVGTYKAIVKYGDSTGIHKVAKEFKIVEKLACTDSDGGKNIYVKGSASSGQDGFAHVARDVCVLSDSLNSPNKIVDSCTGDNCYIMEAICVDDKATSAKLKCSGGCTDGACQREFIGIVPTDNVEFLMDDVYDVGEEIDIKIVNKGEKEITYTYGCGVQYTIKEWNGRAYDELIVESPCTLNCKAFLFATLEPGETGSFGAWTQTEFDDVCSYDEPDQPEKVGAGIYVVTVKYSDSTRNIQELSKKFEILGDDVAYPPENDVEIVFENKNNKITLRENIEIYVINNGNTIEYRAGCNQNVFEIRTLDNKPITISNPCVILNCYGTWNIVIESDEKKLIGSWGQRAYKSINECSRTDIDLFKYVSPGFYQVVFKYFDQDGNDFTVREKFEIEDDDDDLCDTLKTNTDSSKYFDICASEGYSSVCFNKINSEYQGCGILNHNTCTQNNVNANSNILCDVEVIGYLIDKINSITIDNIGQPIEGFTPFMYLKVFPGLLKKDFDRVEAVQGVYYYNNGELIFEWDADVAIHSAGESISDEGMLKLIHNLERRFFDIKSKEDAQKLIQLIRIEEASGIVRPIEGRECTVGCLYDSSCIPYGTRLVDEDKPLYCNINGKLLGQNVEETSCQNSYECTSNTCASGFCTDLVGEIRETNSLIEKVLSWLSRIFG